MPLTPLLSGLVVNKVGTQEVSFTSTLQVISGRRDMDTPHQRKYYSSDFESIEYDFLVG